MPPFDQLRQLLASCMELEPEERAAFLDRECADSPTVRREIESILGADADLPSLLATGGVDRLLSWHSTLGGETVAHPVLQAPTTIGPYRVIATLGEGGMGTVYLAEQTKPIRRKVAIKLIKTGMDTKGVVSRFEAERQALAVMNHPNIAKVLDAGATEEGRPYFVMEYVRGKSITEYCDRERLDPTARMNLFVSVCGAIHHAHQKGILHRDIKPSNVLITLLDGVPVPKVIDFGIAKATGQRLFDHTALTAIGQIVGTPEYMSPEQADGDTEDIDATTDVYSLGVLLYELLTGTVPIDRSELRRAGLEAVRRTIRHQDPPLPSRRVTERGETGTETAERRQTTSAGLARQIRGDLDWITMRALQEDRSRRYPSASELAADIGRFLRHDAVEARPPSAMYATRKLVRRHKMPFAFAGSLVIVLIAFSITMSVMFQRQTVERRRAERSAAKAETVNAFLHDLLGAASPEETLGRPMSVQDVLEHAVEKLDVAPPEDPEVQGEIRRTLGRSLLSLGDHAGALEQLSLALPILEEAMGPDSAITLEAAGWMAAARYEAGEFDQAEPDLRRLVESHKRVSGSHSEIYASSLRNWGLVRLQQGEETDAVSALREALEVMRAIPDVGLANLAATLNHLSMVVCRQSGGLAEAEELCREALAIRKEIHGPVHPEVVESQHNLSAMVRASGRIDEALEIELAAVELAREIWKDGHPFLAKYIREAAGLVRQSGRTADAATMLEEALEMQRRLVRKDHPDIGSTLNSLAYAHRRMGELALAEREYREALANRRLNFQRVHPNISNVTSNLAWLLRLRGKQAEAIPLYEESIELNREIYGTDHAQVTSPLTGLGLALTELGRPGEAEAPLREALAIRVVSYGDSHWRTAQTRSALGGCLVGLGRLGEAEEALLEALPVIRESSSDPAELILETLDRLAKLFEAHGDMETATRYRGEAARERQADD